MHHPQLQLHTQKDARARTHSYSHKNIGTTMYSIAYIYTHMNSQSIQHTHMYVYGGEFCSIQKHTHTQTQLCMHNHVIHLYKGLNVHKTNKNLYIQYVFTNLQKPSIYNDSAAQTHTHTHTQRGNKSMRTRESLCACLSKSKAIFNKIQCYG